MTAEEIADSANGIYIGMVMLGRADDEILGIIGALASTILSRHPHLLASWLETVERTVKEFGGTLQ